MKKTLTISVILITTAFFAQQTYVPDDNFEQALINLGYDSGALDDYVPTTNINTITYLYINNKNIADLTGIQDFVALQTLRCHSNQLTSLDISNNTALTALWCYSNQLTSLDISNNTALDTLWCRFNQLTNLDVSNNTALLSLSCSYNQLTNLDVSNNTSLTNLSCDGNELTSLDVSNNTALSSLSCDDNQLTNLDISNNTGLTALSCDDNQLTNLDISNNTGLTALSCADNQLLTSLNVKNGNNTNIYDDDFEVENNPNLTCIIVDDAAWSTANWTSYIDATSTFVNNQAACDALASVSENNLENQISIFPNPAANSIHIQNDAGYVIDAISIYTILGKLIYQYKDIQNSIDVSDLSNGMYLIKLNSNNKIITKKIIINK